MDLTAIAVLTGNIFSQVFKPDTAAYSYDLTINCYVMLRDGIAIPSFVGGAKLVCAWDQERWGGISSL